jgi:hypothetical protein
MVCASDEATFTHTAHSSSGLGHRPLKAKITGSNPVCATQYLRGLTALTSSREFSFARDFAHYSGFGQAIFLGL